MFWVWLIISVILLIIAFIVWCMACTAYNDDKSDPRTPNDILFRRMLWFSVPAGLVLIPLWPFFVAAALPAAFLYGLWQGVLALRDYRRNSKANVGTEG